MFIIYVTYYQQIYCYPKSQITKSASESGVLNNKFSGFMSKQTNYYSHSIKPNSKPLCIILCECKYSNPCNIERIITTASFSENFPLSNSRSNSSPPVAL